jgi:hypothetical protein
MRKHIYPSSPDTVHGDRARLLRSHKNENRISQIVVPLDRASEWHFADRYVQSCSRDDRVWSGKYDEATVTAVTIRVHHRLFKPGIPHSLSNLLRSDPADLGNAC